MEQNSTQSQPQGGKRHFPRQGILAIIIVFVLLIIVPTFYFSSFSSLSGASSPTPAIPPSSTPLPIKTAVPVSIPWDLSYPLSYTHAKYTILYPQGWKLEPFVFTGGESMVIKPSSLGEKEFLPSLIVTFEENSSDLPLSKRQDLYVKSLGFQKDTIPFQNISATRLRGLPPKTPHHEVRIFFDKGGYTYLLIYQYDEKKYNGAEEQLFQQIISTFQITQ